MNRLDHTNNTLRCFASLGLWLALNGANVVDAQADPPPPHERVLGKHRFPVAEFSPTPFVLTAFAMRVGVEEHEVPGYPQSTSLSTSAHPRVDLTSLLVAEAFDLSLRLHDRVSIAGAAYGRARVGVNKPTLLNAGIDYTYGGNLAVLVKLVRTRQFQLSLRGGFGASTGQIVGIGLLFDDLTKIADQAIADQKNQGLTQEVALQQLRAAFQAATSELLTPFNTWTASGAVTMALAFNSYLGLQASVGFAADNSTYNLTQYQADSRTLLHYDRSMQALRPTATLALDFDAQPARIPIDVMLEYQLAPTWAKTSVLHSDTFQSAVEQLVGLALFYSGRPDLQLGITGFLVFGQTPLLGENSQRSGHPHEIAGRFVFRYIW